MVIKGEGGKVDGAGGARAGWRAGWRGCTENGRRACGVACARRRCARRSGHCARGWRGLRAGGGGGGCARVGMDGEGGGREGGVGSGGGEVWGSRWTTPLVASAAGRTARTNLPRIQDTSARAPRSRCHSLAPELQAQAASALAWHRSRAGSQNWRFSKLDYSRILNGLVDTLAALAN